MLRFKTLMKIKICARESQSQRAINRNRDTYRNRKEDKKRQKEIEAEGVTKKKIIETEIQR